MIRRKVVVFPEPLGPMNPQMLRSGTFSDRLLTAGCRPNVLVTPSISTATRRRHSLDPDASVAGCGGIATGAVGVNVAAVTIRSPILSDRRHGWPTLVEVGDMIRSAILIPHG